MRLPHKATANFDRLQLAIFTASVQELHTYCVSKLATVTVSHF